MTQAARTGNYRVRDLGFIPHIGPALSSIALTLPALLAGQEVLASSFVGGLYFGAPCRLDWGWRPPSVRWRRRCGGRWRNCTGSSASAWPDSAWSDR
jgi:hypothetical protein